MTKHYISLLLAGPGLWSFWSKISYSKSYSVLKIVLVPGYRSYNFFLSFSYSYSGLVQNSAFLSKEWSFLKILFQIIYSKQNALQAYYIVYIINVMLLYHTLYFNHSYMNMNWNGTFLPFYKKKILVSRYNGGEFDYD